MIPKPPIPPTCRIIKEGYTYFCPICHSTASKKSLFKSARYCINNQCIHYYLPINGDDKVDIKDIRKEKMNRMDIR